MRNAKLQHRARTLRNQSTDAERNLWRHLRGKQLGGCRFRRQVPVVGYIADFVCLEAKVIVELDGGRHVQNVGYDEQRDRLIEAQGFRILRFWDNQVFLETQAVLQEIMRVLESRAPHPNLPPQAEEGNGKGDLHPQAEDGGDPRTCSLPPLAGEG